MSTRYRAYDSSTPVTATWLNQVDDMLVGSGTGFSVTKYGAVMDGVTDSQTALVTAVAAAVAAGSDLYWPAGQAVSTANIPNFHSVRHWGPGAVKRGSAVFYVQPDEGQTNTLNIATTGNSANDGLGASQPMATFQNAFDALKNYGPTLNGTWQVQAAAGTYTISTGAQTHSTPSLNRVIIKGPAVGGHPNVPTCIIDGGGNQASYLHGLNMDGIGVRVQVQDIKFQAFTEASGNTRIGLVGANGADLYANNVHTANCSWTGIDAKECEQVRITGGIFDSGADGAYGFISDSSHSSFGYGSTSLATGPIVRNAKSAGVYWSTGSQGHCDYVTFEDCAVAFLCAENSRCDTVGNSYKRNTVAKRAITGGWFASGGAAENFNNGGADANGTNLEFKAYSGDISEGSVQGSGSWQRTAFDRTLRSASGIVTGTFATVYTLPAYRLQGVGKALRVRSFGVYTVTAGSTLTINIGGMAVTLAVPAAATNAAFELEVTLNEVAGGYRAFGTLRHNLASPRMGTATAGFSSTTDQAVAPGYSLTGAGDSLNIYRTDVEIIG
jgi:hypothetical protein